MSEPPLAGDVMRWMLLFLFFSISNHAQEELQVVSMLEVRALVTGRFLPFKVYRGENPEELASISTSAPCKAMVDPFRPTIFHLYCTDSVAASVEVELKSGQAIVLNNIDVKQISLIKPKPVLVSPEPTQNPSLGKSLYDNNCASCHASIAISKPQDATSLRGALNRPPMSTRGLNTIFNSDDTKINALLQFINEEL